MRALAAVAIVTVVVAACSSDYGEGAPSSQDGGTTGADGGGGCPMGSSDPSLLAWYPFDENGGTSVTECSGHGLHGTSIGSTLRWAPGHSPSSGTALDVDGKGCISLGGAPSLAFDSTSRFTIAAWIKPRDYADNANDARELVSRRTSSPLSGWSLATDNPVDVEIDVESAQDDTDIEAQSSAPENVWFHVTGVYDGSLKIYVNGILAKTTPGPVTVVADASGTARIACNRKGEGYDGLVDDLRIYNRALTDSEIASLAKP